MYAAFHLHLHGPKDILNQLTIHDLLSKKLNLKSLDDDDSHNLMHLKLSNFFLHNLQF